MPIHDGVYGVFLLFVLIKPVPGILRASTLIRYRFLGVRFSKMYFPRRALKRTPKNGVCGVWWGGLGGLGFRVRKMTRIVF